MYEELIKNLRNCSEVNSLSRYKRDLMKQAADAIADLITALTASNEVIAKSKPKWIPVTERLPETLDYVLCCGAKGGMFVGYIGGFTGPQGSAWAWQHGGKGRRIKWWMLLPQPPEDK